MIIINRLFINSQIKFYIIFSILFVTQKINAQVTVINVLENQIGNYRVGEDNRTGLYDQLNIRYSQNNMYTGIKLETYRSTTDALEGYSTLSQKYIEYRTNRIRIRAGNFIIYSGTASP